MSNRSIHVLCTAALFVFHTTIAVMAADGPPTFLPDQCGSHPWIIPFAPDKTELTSFAIQRLDELVISLRAEPSPVLASGRVDGPEDRQNKTLSSQRLHVVVQALENRGVPSTVIWARDDFGKNGITVNNSEIPEPQNRVVWIETPLQGAKCSIRHAEILKDWIERYCLTSNISTKSKQCSVALDSLVGDR